MLVARVSLSLENWATTMAAGPRTTVVVMGKDLEAGGAACGSKLRSMFDDFERFFPIVGRVGLEAAMVGKKCVDTHPRASPSSTASPRGPGTPTGASRDLGGGLHEPGEAGRVR